MSKYSVAVLLPLVLSGCIGAVNVNNPSITAVANIDAQASLAIATTASPAGNTNPTNDQGPAALSSPAPAPTAAISYGLSPLIATSTPAPSPTTRLALALTGAVLGGTPHHVTLILTFSRPVMNADQAIYYGIGSLTLNPKAGIIEPLSPVTLGTLSGPFRLTNLAQEIRGKGTTNISIDFKQDGFVIPYFQDSYDLPIFVTSTYPDTNTLKDDENVSLSLDGVANVTTVRVLRDFIPAPTPSPPPVVIDQSH